MTKPEIEEFIQKLEYVAILAGRLEMFSIASILYGMIGYILMGDEDKLMQLAEFNRTLTEKSIEEFNLLLKEMAKEKEQGLPKKKKEWIH